MPALCYSEDTKLNDALRAQGIIPPLPKAESPPDSPICSNHDDAKDRLGLLLDNAFTTDALVKLELDNLDLEDELPTDIIEAWRESRLEALSGANAVRREASQVLFATVSTPYRSTGAIIFPISDNTLFMIAGRSSFDDYPDANQPTLLCYRGGRCVQLANKDIHLAMTLGYITDRMTAAILTLPESTWPLQKKTRAVRAFHKIGWIHNDLLARHHTEEAYAGSTFSSPRCSSPAVFAAPEHSTPPTNPIVSGSGCCPMQEDSLEAEPPIPVANGTIGSCFSNYRADSGWNSDVLSGHSNYPNPCEPPTARLMDSDSHSPQYSGLGFERTYSGNETDHLQMHSKGDYST
ncbi:uncharacterized protein MELLADRAFT_102276 [Melampsora larici-populina 98AG31]|uniref:Uncharacterized protein n=1 Tax=Melampsora larici-populina (strain 98AG31 / pathotype 3-4-7) TaxID=747676 RepID=F4R7S0_MELLP|nr:uncharacterized protein MELLADRAFT_102276 [Melampsora larici-populina 98AG31]EGG11735.1 hypothetical protein MELLADRAFT_102276 [Melampsora larici-populina 98AG31]